MHRRADDTSDARNDTWRHLSHMTTHVAYDDRCDVCDICCRGAIFKQPYGGAAGIVLEKKVLMDWFVFGRGGITNQFYCTFYCIDDVNEMSMSTS
jgi:hypothetical protein